MKLLVGLNKKGILDYLNYTNSFIIGLKDFSINYQEYSIDEIKALKKEYPNIELFVSVNKNIFNSDLTLLEERLTELSKLDITGVLFTADKNSITDSKSFELYDTRIIKLCLVL